MIGPTIASNIQLSQFVPLQATLGLAAIALYFVFQIIYLLYKIRYRLREIASSLHRIERQLEEQSE